MSRKHRGQFRGDSITYKLPSPAGGVQLETFIPWTLVKRGMKKQVITPLDAPQEFLAEARQEKEKREAEKDTPLMRALGLAHYWQHLLDEGKYQTITEIAKAEGMDLGQASRIIQLTRLATDIIEACVANQELQLTLERLIRYSIPACWEDQRQKFLTLRDLLEQTQGYLS